MITVSEQLEKLHQALRTLCVLQIHPPAEGAKDAEYAAVLLECTAHRDVVSAARALQPVVHTGVRLRQFEENYLSHLSRVYRDLGTLLDDSSDFSWVMVNSAEAERLRPIFIANVAALAAELHAGLLQGRYSLRPDSACSVVRGIDAELNTWLRRQPSVGEESITDWLLFQMSERAAWITYQKFTRHQEARESGADWEWWLVGDDGALGMRVQAKRLSEQGDAYPQLAYANRHGLQIERLIEDARRFDLLPLYALYYASPSAPVVRCHDPSDDSAPYAVFMADAVQFHSDYVLAGRKRLDALQLLADSCPLACLFCCGTRAEGSSITDDVFQFVRRHFAGAANEFPRVHERPPAYVEALMDPSAAGEDAGWIAGEFAERLRNVNALLAFDLRGGGTR